MAMSANRRAVGAGRWFDASESGLRREVSAYVAAAAVDTGAVCERPIVGVVAPHAGFRYSGKVAGFSFRALQENAQAHGAPQLVVVVGFSHRGSFHGCALMDGATFETPAGTSVLDADAARAMCARHPETIRIDWRPHNGEHSAENEVPFVQRVFPDVPLVVALLGEHGDDTLDAVVDALEDLAKTKRVFVVASSDMLHDADWNLVTRTDRATLELAARLDHGAVQRSWNYDHQVFCGIGPVLVLMRLAERRGAKRGIVLHYRNSGDDHPESRGEWVVGYGAVAFL